MSVETLVKEYHQLSDSEKALFIELIELNDEVNDLSPEWIQEIEKRWQAFESGSVETLDSEAADRQIIAEYGIKL
jgi:succinate dehydrogenase flavin-adding protein (antitoxin of CptAB toxin-antitoxin module)